MPRALIPNSTQVPDVILDHWMAELSGAEFKVLLYIARRTYGFGKDSDTISLTQIAQGITRRDGTVLDRGTGISRASVARALKTLEGHRIVIRRTNLSETGREFEENTYSINLDWKPKEGGGGSPPGSGGGQSEPPGVVSKCDHPRSESMEGVVSKCDHVVSGANQGWSQNVTGVVSKSYTQETGQETALQETAAARDLAQGTQGAADESLVKELVHHGVGRGAAERLARTKPGVCRQCLEYLPFAKVRTTNGAWLANAIRDEYGPPEGFLRARAKEGTSATTRASGEKAPGTNALTRGNTIGSRLRAFYGELERTQPRAIAAFLEYLLKERERGERFAQSLTARGRKEYLGSFETEEGRLGLFERWLKEEGQALLGPGAGRAPGEGRPAAELPGLLPAPDLPPETEALRA